MFLNEVEQNKLSKNKISIINNQYKKRKNYSKNYTYLTKKASSFNEKEEEERISLTEHSNILSEYEKELNFLCMKRKNINVIDNNTISNENSDNYKSVILCPDNKISDLQRKKYNNKKHINHQKEHNDIVKMSELFKLYHYLFIKSGLDCLKPSRFIDYFANEINETDLNLISREHKINFDHMRKIALNLKKEDENILIYKIINEYFHCSFKNSIIEKLIEKMNKILINKNNNYIETKNNNNISNNAKDNNSFSCNYDSFDKSSKYKRDKSSYSNILVEKLKNNNYNSSLSLTNDIDFLKSIIYMSNKHSQNINKKNITDKTIIKSLNEYRELLKSFREENKESSNINDINYLNDLLTNKKLKKYINKKLISIKESFNNNILNILDKNNFHKIINLLLINYKKEDKNKVDLINNLQSNEKINDNDISFFLLLINFMIGITVITTYPNLINKNDFGLLNTFFQYIKQFNFDSNKKVRKRTKPKIKKLKNKEKNNHKIKIRIDSNEGSLNDNSISLVEEQKLEEENKILEQKIEEEQENKIQKNNKIIKIFLDKNNELSISDNNLNFNTIKLSNKDNDNKINNNYIVEHDNIDSDNRNYLHYNLIKNKKNSFKVKYKSKIENTINKTLKENNELLNCNILNNDNIYSNDNLNIFQKKLLNELSLGNDIFKISYAKSKENKELISNNNEKDIEVNNKITINIDEEIRKINVENNLINSNNNNNFETKIIKKKGNKIIIFSEDFFEENKNDSNNINL